MSLSFPTQGSHYHPLKNALFAKANVHKEEQAFREDMEKTSKWMMEARIGNHSDWHLMGDGGTSVKNLKRWWRITLPIRKSCFTHATHRWFFSKQGIQQIEMGACNVKCVLGMFRPGTLSTKSEGIGSWNVVGKALRDFLMRGGGSGLRDLDLAKWNFEPWYQNR